MLGTPVITLHLYLFSTGLRFPLLGIMVTFPLSSETYKKSNAVKFKNQGTVYDHSTLNVPDLV
jgi:hypothetical protein